MKDFGGKASENYLFITTSLEKQPRPHQVENINELLKKKRLYELYNLLEVTGGGSMSVTD